MSRFNWIPRAFLGFGILCLASTSVSAQPKLDPSVIYSVSGAGSNLRDSSLREHSLQFYDYQPVLRNHVPVGLGFGSNNYMQYCPTPHNQNQPLTNTQEINPASRLVRTSDGRILLTGEQGVQNCQKNSPK